MDYYTIMLVVDVRSPVKRFRIAKKRVRQLGFVLVSFVLLVAAAGWDYNRVRADNIELAGLRVEVSEQRELIRGFEGTLSATRVALDGVRALERKVRIIANLPGAAGVGGEGVTELLPAFAVGEEGTALLPPAGVPIEVGPATTEAPAEASQGAEATVSEAREHAGLTTEAARHVNRLASVAEEVSARAGDQTMSLEQLIAQLEAKRHRLVSMPSVWPMHGWLTSRFGPRVSPFTGRPQRHAGIDIAAREGTPVKAPGRGRVASIGRSGPLGNSVRLDHGFGVHTVYGHTADIFVKVGQEVQRGQKVASVGSTGRSTGPHLHYAVEVNGKARDPLDYIFD